MAFGRGDAAVHSGVALSRCNTGMEKQRECTRGKDDSNVVQQWLETEYSMKRRDIKQRERERGEKEAGWRSPLEHPQSTSPERCINISHTHTHTKQTAWHTACVVTEERVRQRENVEALRHSVQLHASHFSIFIRRFIRNGHILRSLSLSATCLHTSHPIRVTEGLV